MFGNGCALRCAGTLIVPANHLPKLSSRLNRPLPDANKSSVPSAPADAPTSLRIGVLAGEPGLNLISVLGGEGKAPMFWDAATALAEALANRGLKVRLTRNELARAGTNYLFGVNVLTAWAKRSPLPRGSVLVNSEPIAQPEQVAGAVDWPAYLPMLEGMHVWDYSVRNIDAFVRAKIPALSYSWVPVGFAERNLIPPRSTPVTQDIDVLFYGRINDRRARVLDACRALGLNVVAVTSGCVEAERAALLARAKVVLNVGAVDASVFEQYRVSYLMNNGKAVVTEMHADERLPEEYTAALVVARYDELAETCARLVTDHAWRTRLGGAGSEVLKLPLFAQCLDTALARLSAAKDEL